MEDGIFWVILLIPLISVAGYVIRATSLQSKFTKLGSVNGRTHNEIIAVVGPPNSVSAIGPNQTLMQWQTTRYHIALKFTGDICDGITHEYRAGL